MFTLPDLPFDYSALEPHIDEQTMHIHHDKHHAGYVSNLNAVLEGHEELLRTDVNQLLKDLDTIPEDIRTKVRNNGGGHANHSLFWTVMSPNQGSQPEGKVLKALIGAFGSVETFKEKFTQLALGRFGSGWAWLVVDGAKLAMTDTPNQDSPVSEGKTPILGLDVWEHAYYLKYQNRRADYITAWWNVVNWQEVEKRFSNVMK